jgi:Secretion system C-terminal sorting domain/Fibronectin type III domain
LSALTYANTFVFLKKYTTMLQKSTYSKASVFLKLMLFSLCLFAFRNSHAQITNVCSTKDTLGSSANLFTNIYSETNPVAVDPASNTVVFIHRNNATLLGGNTGQYRYDISTNGGATWTKNVGPLNTGTSDLGRYPNVVLHNPTNSTLSNNVYLNFLGSALNTSSVFNSFISGTKKLDNTVNNSLAQVETNADVMTSMVKGATNTFWSVDRDQTNQKIRIYKGVWNATLQRVDWTLNSAQTPSLDLTFNGGAYWTRPCIAFDPTGQKGWVSFLGDVVANASTKRTYAPVFFKTINGGTSWTGPIALNVDSLYYPNTCLASSMNATGFYQPTCGIEHDLTVDYLGNPHMLTVITKTGGSYALNWFQNQFMADITFKYNKWCAVDNGYYHIGGPTTYGTVPNQTTMDQMPQISRSADGKKIFFGYADYFFQQAGQPIISPNLYVCGVNVETNLRTNLTNTTSCLPNGNNTYYPHMATDITQPSAGTYKTFACYSPFNATLDPNTTVDFAFIDDVTFTDGQFNKPFNVAPPYDTVTSCPGYVWHGTTYNTSGNYTWYGNPVNYPGCPTTHYLNLTIIPGTVTTSNVTACDTYTWANNGNTYTTSGTYTNVIGTCDTQKLVLTINASTNNTNTVSACNSYTWSVNGTTYTTSGTYMATTTNSAGCPSTETLILTINSSSSNTTNTTACDSYTWGVNGITYTSSGTYTSTSTNASGCMHTETLNLTINTSSSNNSTATACDTYTWAINGQTYTSSGTYTSASINASGCMHTETLNLTINASTSNITTATACDYYTWLQNGQTYLSSGTYTATSINANGCTHTEILNLTINTTTSNTVQVNACDTYTWFINGQPYTMNTSGAYVVGSLNAAGCTHTDTLNLTINASTSNTTNPIACDTYTWAVDGQTYTSSGTYVATSTNASGCVHTETLNLTINTSTSYTTNAIACDTYTWVVNGQTYTVTGVYTATSTNAAGCVHTETLNLTINANTSSTITATACDYYTWAQYAQSFAASGTYVMVATNSAGCNLTETLNLTINNSTYNTTATSACDAYTWAVDGQTYTSSGTYVSTSMNNVGCTHTETLYLTINSSTSNTTSVNACGSYTWAVNGMTYTSSGTYTASSTNANGCTQTETINLTISPTTPNTTTASACGTYTWSVNGMTYTNSGTYTYLAGCVLETLNLTVTPINNTNTIQTSCVSYTWPVNGMTYTTSGTYTYSAFTCVTQTLYLTINSLPTVTAPNVAACAGNPVSLGGTPAGGTWNLANPYSGSATSYTYYYTDANGCTNSATGTVSAVSAIISGVNVTNITGISASVNYSAINGIGWYEVRWRLVGSSVWLTGTNNFSTTKNLINLTPNSNYEVQVRGFCSSSSAGPWSASTIFNTTAICAAPTAVVSTSVTATQAVISWTAAVGAAYYNLRYRVAPNGTWTTVSNVTNPKTLVGLTPSTLYDVQVACGCANALSAWSANAQFTTSVGCAAPTGLFVNNITATTAKLNWTAVPGAAYYTVRYKKTSASTWITGTSSSSTKNIAGLMAGGTYTFQVMTNCVGSNSGWSTTSTFTTNALKQAEVGTMVEENTWNVYPNPAHDELTIQYSVKEAHTTLLKLVDMSGRVVKQLNTMSEEGLNEIALDLHDLANGIYTLQVYSNNELVRVTRVSKN